MKANIRIINDVVIEVHTPERNMKFVTRVARPLCGKFNRNKSAWTFNIHQKEEVIAGVKDHFDDITSTSETVQVIDRKSDTRRKILLGAAIMAHLNNVKGSDDPDDVAFKETIDSLIDNMRASRDRILFTAEVL